MLFAELLCGKIVVKLQGFMTWWQLSTSAGRNNLHTIVEIVSMAHGLILSTPQSRSSGNSSTLKKSTAVQSLQKVTRSVWSWTRKRWGEVSCAGAAKCKVHPSQSQSLNRGSHNLSSHYPQTLVIKLCPFTRLPLHRRWQPWECGRMIRGNREKDDYWAFGSLGKRAGGRFC